MTTYELFVRTVGRILKNDVVMFYFLIIVVLIIGLAVMNAITNVPQPCGEKP